MIIEFQCAESGYWNSETKPPAISAVKIDGILYLPSTGECPHEWHFHNDTVGKRMICHRCGEVRFQ